MRLIAAALLPAAGAGGPAVAADEAGGPLEEIVITARPAAEEDAAAPVVVLGSARLAGVLRIDEALMRAPLFSAFRRMDSRTAHPTTSTASLLVKGPNATSRALVVVDGIPFNDPFSAAVAWSALPPVLIHSLTLDPRPAAGAFGDLGEGGVVAVTTRLAAGGEGLAISSSGGSQGDAALSVFAARQHAGLRLAAYGFADRSGGFHPVPRFLRGPVDERARSKVAGGGFGVSGTLGGRQRWRWQLRAAGFRDSRANGLEGADNSTRGIETAAILAGALGNNLTLSAAAFHRRRLFRNRFVAVLDEPRSRVRPVLDQFRVPGRASGGNIDLAWAGLQEAGLRIVVGLDGERREGATNERFRNLGAGFTRLRLAQGRSTRIGGYFDARLNLGAGWRLGAALRADHWALGPGREIIRDLPTAEVRESRSFAPRRGAVLSGGLELAGGLGRGLAVGLSARRGWRLPTINELYRPFRVGNTATLANPELEPERLEALVLSLFPDGPPTPWGWRIEGYYARLSDGIGNLTIGAGPGVFPSVGFLPADGILRRRENIPRLRTAGVGIRLGGPLWRGAELALAGHVRDERITRAPAFAPDLEGRRVAQAPRLAGEATLGQELGPGLRLSVSGRYRGLAFEDDRASLPLDRAFLLDAAVVWSPAPGWRFAVRAENLLNATVMNSRAGDGFFTRISPLRLLVTLEYSR